MQLIAAIIAPTYLDTIEMLSKIRIRQEELTALTVARYRPPG
jgi:hypothetical protein